MQTDFSTSRDVAAYLDLCSPIRGGANQEMKRSFEIVFKMIKLKELIFKTRVLIFLLSLLIIVTLSYGWWLDSRRPLYCFAYLTVLEVRPENRLTVFLSGKLGCGSETKTIEISVTPEELAFHRGEPIPGSNFEVGVKYLWMDDYRELERVYICSRKGDQLRQRTVWSCGLPKRIKYYFLLALSKFY
jgi:hypothetical protein